MDNETVKSEFVKACVSSLKDYMAYQLIPASGVCESHVRSRV